MPFEIFQSTWRRYGRMIWTWGAALTGLAFLAAAFYPAVRGLRAGFPAALWASGLIYEPFAPQDPIWWTSTAGFHGLIPLLMCVFALLMGSRLIALDQDNGSLALLLAAPISRRRLWWQKAAVLFAALLVFSTLVCLMLWVGMALNGYLLPVGRLAAAGINQAMLAGVFGSCALAINAGAGRLRGVWAGVLCLLAAYLLHILPIASTPLAELHLLSPFTYAFAFPPLRDGLNLTPFSVLVGLQALLLVLGAWRFERRDLEI